eukprot:10505833-Karenia_brevis.AAC.1
MGIRGFFLGSWRTCKSHIGLVWRSSKGHVGGPMGDAQVTLVADKGHRRITWRSCGVTWGSHRGHRGAR